MWVQQCHKPSPNHLPFYRWYVYQPFPVLAPQALGHRVAGLSEHEHDGQGATVSLFCLASSLFYVHAYIYLSIYLYIYIFNQLYLCIYLYIYTYIHTLLTYIHTYLHTCIHPSMHPRAYVRKPISRGSQLLAGRRRGDWPQKFLGSEHQTCSTNIPNTRQTNIKHKCLPKWANMIKHVYFENSADLDT
jgi:hypothetical protein